MKISVKYFASIREGLGQASEVLDTEALTLGALRDELIARGGAYSVSLARDRLVRMALDQVMSPETAPLTPDCEVAFFPPVTGG